MVYLPAIDEDVITNENNRHYLNFWNNKQERAKNVYTVVKFSGNEIYFLKHDVSKIIVNRLEFGSQNCYQLVNDVSIKEYCLKIRVDRLGNIKPF